MPQSQVVHADCLELLPRLRPECVDAFVCDPPYGLAFMGKGWDHAVPGPEYWEAALRVAKPGAHLVAFGGTRTYHRLACAIEDAGWELRDCLMWLYGTGFPKSHNLKEQWEGWGTALKPGWEPIILARKPFKQTVAKNVQAHGTGALNIDGCRIGYGSEADKASARPVSMPRQSDSIGTFATRDRRAESPEAAQSDQGRWPANVVLDPEAGAMLDAQTGTLKSGSGNKNTRNRDNGLTIHAGLGAGKGDGIGGDSGGASRFFYCAKAPKSEREAGLEDFGQHRVDDGRAIAADNAYQRGKTERRNTHPTVKPIALMRWLVRLVTPSGGLVCDPFCGSGSTGCAAVAEGFDFLGIEKEAEYAALANARINHD